MIVITTSKGEIELELDDSRVKDTCDNFRYYLNKGYYNDTIFHRVISNFMIQGGGMNSAMEQKSTTNGIINQAKWGKANKRGTIAMARTSAPHSATAQFFINLKDNFFLDFTDETPQGFGYCVFGEVTKGMAVVDLIATAKTGLRLGHADVPLDDILILGIVEK